MGVDEVIAAVAKASVVAESTAAVAATTTVLGVSTVAVDVAVVVNIEETEMATVVEDPLPLLLLQATLKGLYWARYADFTALNILIFTLLSV